MIDIEARSQFAQALRQLLTGTINNVEFDHLNIEDSSDPGVYAIWYSVWLCYDDFAVHELRLTDGQILDFKRCILFLHSDLEYEWSDSQSLLKRTAGCIRDIVGRISGKGLSNPTPELNYRYWPFARLADYKEALDKPKLLTGIGAEQDVSPKSDRAGG